MKKNKSGGLVHVPRRADLGPVGKPPRVLPHPADLYLEGLAESSRPAMQSGLNAIARLVNPGATMYTTDWEGMRYEHTKTIRAQLVKRYKPRTVNRMIASLRGVLRNAWSMGLMTTDDYHRAIQVKHEKTSGLPPAGRWVETHEIVRLLTAAGERSDRGFRDQALVIVLYAGGLRREETSELNVSDYDPATGELEVQRGKRSKYRKVYIPEGYRPWLLPWWQLRKEAGAVPFFVGWTRHRAREQRLTPDGVDTALRSIQRRAGIAKLTPHDMRRSYATELLEHGADLLQVQKLMGHASVNTTSIYDRRGERGKKAAMEKFPVALRYEDLKKDR